MLPFAIPGTVIALNLIVTFNQSTPLGFGQVSRGTAFGGDAQDAQSIRMQRSPGPRFRDSLGEAGRYAIPTETSQAEGRRFETGLALHSSPSSPSSYVVVAFGCVGVASVW